MAISRCEKHGKPNGHRRTYAARPRIPVGNPDSGVICGRTVCRNPGLLWLTLDEERTYEVGERIFEMYTAAVKVRVR
jgi:hypothetical protein